MDARKLTFLGAVGSLLFLAASYRTENFLVSASDPEQARQVAQAAEHYRQQLATEWLGAELPRWEELCVVQAEIHPKLAAGGQTSFYFVGGRPRGWEMLVQGSLERVLDSVLPHEITHTILATHFGRPLPRWADEGAATTVEHWSERAKQQQWLVQFLSSRPSRGIPFNTMFRMREYPSDILPLYSQGYALTEFLVAQGGRRHFVDFLQQGMQKEDWAEATRAFYGYESLSELQTAWVEWVARGRPEPIPQDLAGKPRPGQRPSLAASTDPAPQASDAVVEASRSRDSLSTALAVTGSWYERVASASGSASVQNQKMPSRLVAGGNMSRQSARAPQPSRVELIVLEPVAAAPLQRP
ncbi:MAG: hypothetical protein KatS3mg110_3474 [Pirellulaceae bacterium]|nr:MAG: hypothetical protein KatS3mg110_3474 [Pirellulaceae bacterium]